MFCIRYYQRELKSMTDDNSTAKQSINNTIKATGLPETTDFKFDTRVPRDNPDMTPKHFPKGGVVRVT